MRRQEMCFAGVRCSRANASRLMRYNLRNFQFGQHNLELTNAFNVLDLGHGRRYYELTSLC